MPKTAAAFTPTEIVTVGGGLVDATPLAVSLGPA
jgi:hypothetical protein